MIPGSANPLLLASQDTGYRVQRSLRFNAPDSSFLSRTPGSAGNRRTWTWAGWVKQCGLSTFAKFFGAGSSGTNRTDLGFNNDNTLSLLWAQSAVYSEVKTTAVFRDVSAWYHIVASVDTTQATAADRIRLYVNGAQITQLATAQYPSQNYDTFVNSTNAHNIGRAVHATDYLSGYLADIHFIDGQALDPTSFGEFDATTGVWVPKAYTGSYGTNGFQLKFEDNSSNTATTLGKDTSPNGNNWTPNNLSIVTGGPTSVAAASGALPIFNTTDTYGDTVGSGVRSDAFAANIACAVPLGTASGLNTTDQSPAGRVSATKTVTNNSGTSNTSISQFYGGSLYINGSSGTRLYVDGFTSFASNYSTNFTIECWVYPVAVTNNGNMQIFHNDRATVPGTFQVYWNGSGFQGSGLTGTSTGASANRWYHIAYVRNGSTNTLYVNGVATLSGTGSVVTAAAYAFLIIGERIQGDVNNFRGQAYYADLRAYEAAKYTTSFNPPSRTQNPTIGAGNDSLVDVPTNGAETDTGAGGEVRGNYCTWNPLNISGGVLANGNLDLTNTGGGRKVGTVAVSSGKWYWEITVTSAGDAMIGIMPPSNPANTGSSNYLGGVANEYGYYGSSGQKYNNGSATSYGATYTNGAVIGIALDMDAGTLIFYKNNTSQGTAFSGLSGTFAPAASAGGSSGASMTANFGQRPFAYTAPSGFKALNTANLPAPLVTKPSDLFDVKLYTGNGSTQTISGLGFSPDLVWMKVRSTAYNHTLIDSVRGATKTLSSSMTVQEYTEPTGPTAFTSDGWSMSGDVTYVGSVNASGQTYAAWAWDAGTTTTTNTVGSISSQVRANASAGFSVVTYTGNGVSGATVGHGLGVAPSIMIIKNRSATSGWDFQAFGTIRMSLNLTEPNQGNVLSNFTSTTFSLSGNLVGRNTNTNNYVAYCFAPVAGYSAFGSYTGNGSADGPFVYLGFRPAVVLVKMSSSTGNWTMLDSKREGYNVDNDPLFPNLSNAEGTTDLIDITSNGFKVRTTDATFNTNTGTYVFAAWAESPFQHSRAR